MLYAPHAGIAVRVDPQHVALLKMRLKSKKAFWHVTQRPREAVKAPENGFRMMLKSSSNVVTIEDVLLAVDIYPSWIASAQSKPVTGSLDLSAKSSQKRHEHSNGKQKGGLSLYIFSFPSPNQSVAATSLSRS